MNYYEVLYILNPNSNKEQIAEVMSEVSGFVEKKKHGIVNHDYWGTVSYTHLTLPTILLV